MEDILLPRHVIDCIERRRVSRRQQAVEAWKSDKDYDPVQTRNVLPTIRGLSLSSSNALAEQRPDRLAAGRAHEIPNDPIG